MVTVQAPGRRARFAGLRKAFALGTGLVLVLCVALAFHLALADLWWGVTHHWRASCFGSIVELPVGWRQVERPDRQQRVDLRNAVAEVPWLRPPDQISLWESRVAFDPVE